MADASTADPLSLPFYNNDAPGWGKGAAGRKNRDKDGQRRTRPRSAAPHPPRPEQSVWAGRWLRRPAYIPGPSPEDLDRLAGRSCPAIEEIPSTKSQITNKHQALNHKDQTLGGGPA